VRHAGAKSPPFGGDDVCLDGMNDWNCYCEWLLCSKNPFNRFQQPPEMKDLRLGMKSAYKNSDRQAA
jgi:hypothetical protein